MKKYLILILTTLVTGIWATQISEAKVKELIMKNQNLICNYDSITYTESITFNDTMHALPRTDYNLLDYITNADSLMCGITKFPFLEDNIWVFSHVQDSLTISSITSNNTAIDYYLQDIHYVFDNDLTEIIRLEGKIYTKSSLYEKDCEYFLYQAHHSKFADIFLPDSVSYYYYSQQDTTLSRPVLTLSNSYQIMESSNKEFIENKWVKKIDCSKCKITNDEELLKRFFRDKIFEEKICFLTGELLDWQKNFEHIGASLDSTVTVEFNIMKNYAEFRVWKVSLSDEAGNGTDYYVQLNTEYDNIKIARIRSFVLPGFYYPMAEEILANENSTAEELYFAQSIFLQLSSDNKLAAYFKDNKRDFKRLLKMYLKDDRTDLIMFDPIEIASEENSKYTKLLKNLQLSYIGRNEEAGFIEFSLGGHLDNSIGYIYCKDESKLPLIFKSNYILLEKICKYWYLYKTT
ncbi:MAG: hypothetical protein K9J13_11800 [Saprospiraceae bacterium]|nr:hypothetical protein [Saprospiraceae bacterium]